MRALLAPALIRKMDESTKFLPIGLLKMLAWCCSYNAMGLGSGVWFKRFCFLKV